MARTVQEVSTDLLMVRPDASSFIESFLILASPWIRKSGACASGPASPSLDQTRKPNDLMRCLSTFSASCERTGGIACAVSALETVIDNATLGSPLLRMKLMRSSLDNWLSDFWMSLTLMTARACACISPSWPVCAASSCNTVLMKAPGWAISFCCSSG